MNSFFDPKSIAVIGASNDPKKLGYEVFKNLNDFKGEKYPINVKEDEVMGKKAFDSVRKVDEEIDLAIVIVPAKHTPETMEELGEKGVKAAVIITGGFKEAGREELEQEVLDIAKENDIRIIGPNCVGIKNTHNNINGTFIKEAKEGDIAFISQSGALGAAMIYKTVDQNIGLSKFISVGNMADVDVADLLEYLDNDEDTEAITLYIEGITDGKKFLEAAKSCSKPIIALKGGKSEAGSKATSSHTGSLAGSHEVYEAAFKQSGIITARNFDEMFAMARGFSQPLPQGKNVAILTNAGGGGVLVSDKIDELGLKLTDLEERTIKNLEEVLPPMAAVTNPVDTIASARGEDYQESAKILFKDKNVDIIIVVCVVPTFAGMKRDEHAEGIINAVNQKGDKPVVTAYLAGEVSEEASTMLEKEGIPNFKSLDQAALAAYALYKYSNK